MLISRFRYCSKNVKLVLYIGLSAYVCMRWHFRNITRLLFFVNKAYNKCIKKLFGYKRCDSVSGIFLELLHILQQCEAIVSSCLILSTSVLIQTLVPGVEHKIPRGYCGVR